MKACPKCKSVSKRRMIRQGIVKLIPGSKSYACDKCNAMYTWISFINQSLRVY